MKIVIETTLEFSEIEKTIESVMKVDYSFSGRAPGGMGKNVTLGGYIRPDDLPALERIFKDNSISFAMYEDESDQLITYYFASEVHQLFLTGALSA